MLLRSQHRNANFAAWRLLVPALVAALPASALGQAATLPAVRAMPPDSARMVVAGARSQVGVTVGYDPSYARIPYPGGDVSRETGVCTDVVVRAFRAGGIDLQRAVHEDMRRAFSSYPRLWGRDRPDPNIDHRRVPNLMAYFRRAGRSLPLSRDMADYRPGDVVAWDLGGGVRHIGIVSDRRSPTSNRLLIVHNIGAGAREEDVLFSWRIIGHYRWFR